MFIAVVFGRILAAVMAFCGVFGVICFFQTNVQEPGAGGFASGLALAAWPLAAAAIIFTLVQVAILLEKLITYNMMASAVQLPSQHAKKEVNSQAKSVIPQTSTTQGHFFHIAPDSIPAPSPEELREDLRQEITAAEPALQTDSNQIAAEIRAADDGGTPHQAAEPLHHPNEELNFFRVD